MKKFDENMTKDEQLLEEKEALFFKMMFAAFEKADAPKYEALHEQLKNNPTVPSTEEEDQAMLDFIAREIKKRDDELAKRNQTGTHPSEKKPVRRRKIFWKIALVAAALLIFMTAAAYAAIPSFRVMALNLLLEVSGEATRIAISDNLNRTVDKNSESPSDETSIILLGYRFPGVPEGFAKESDVQSEQKAWVFYKNNDGNSIKYQVYCGVERDVALDTEDVNAEDILVQGHAGLLSVKDDVIRVSWYEEENKAYCVVMTKGFDTQFVYSLANEVTKVD